MRPFMAGIAGAVAIMKPAVAKKMDRAQNERKRPTFDLTTVAGAAVPVELFVSTDRFRSASAALGFAYLGLRCRGAEMAIFATAVNCLAAIVWYRLDRSHTDQPGLAEATLRQHSDREALGMPDIGHRAVHHRRISWCCGWG